MFLSGKVLLRFLSRILAVAGLNKPRTEPRIIYREVTPEGLLIKVLN